MKKMNRSELMQWAADNYMTTQNSEGTPNEALMAGWVNAMDIQDERGGISEEEFVALAYTEFNNLGYDVA